MQITEGSVASEDDHVAKASTLSLNAERDSLQSIDRCNGFHQAGRHRFKWMY
jgi:hypothetical protein